MCLFTNLQELSLLFWMIFVLFVQKDWFFICCHQKCQKIWERLKNEYEIGEKKKEEMNGRLWVFAKMYTSEWSMGVFCLMRMKALVVDCYCCCCCSCMSIDILGFQIDHDKKVCVWMNVIAKVNRSVVFFSSLPLN